MIKEAYQELCGSQPEPGQTEAAILEDLPDPYGYDAYMPLPQIKHVPYPDWTFEDYNQLAATYQLGHDEPQGRALFEAAKFGQGSGFVVEIGVRWGAGTGYLAAGSKSAKREKVVCVELDRGDPRCLYSDFFWGARAPGKAFKFFTNILMLGIEDWVIPIFCSSKQAAQMLDIPVRVLSIDGCHEGKYPAADILLWKPKLVKGAVVVIHDYNPQGKGHETVKAAVTDHIQNSPDFSDVKVLDDMTAIAIKL